MRVVIVELELAPFYEEFRSVAPESLHDCMTERQFAIQVILSVLHKHCIMALDGQALEDYRSVSSRVRNYVDDAVEYVVIGRLSPIWRSFTNMMRGTIYVKRVRVRRSGTFEVYCE